MRKTKKVLSVICALAMIISMFSTFVVVNAADGLTITNTVGENTGKAGETVTVTLKIAGLPTEKLQAVQFYLNFDGDKFEAVANENGKYVTSALDAQANLVGNQIRFAFSSGDGVAFDGTIGTVSLKIKQDLTEDAAITLDKVKVTDGNGTKYNAASNNLTASNITIEKAPAPKPAVGITSTVSASEYKEGTEIPVTLKIAGLTTEKLQAVQFYLDFDGDTFEAVANENSKYITSALDAQANLVGNQIRFAFSSGDGVAFDGTIGTIVLKLKKDLTEKVKLVGSKVKITDGNGQKYNTADTVYMDDVVIDPAGSTTTKYTVTVADGITNGTVAVDKTTAAAGDKVTVTATPADGYVLDAITVKGADNSDVTVATDNTFTMPAQDVTVSATFSQASTDGYKFTISASNATVTVVDAAGNTVKSGDKVAAGTVLTATVEANSNYTVSAVKFNNTALTANEDGTYTITMPAKIATLSVTTTKNSSYEFTAGVDKTAGTKIGTKYEVTFTDNASFTGTKHDKFDVVVQVYNSSKVAAGYMIFKDVTTTDTVTFYIPKNSTASVNFVDELNDSSNSLGNVIAQKVSK